MEIFEPSNFRNIFDIASSLITGLLALVGVYYAIQTYFIAKEAKDEWKNEKSLDVLVKFSKLFPSSKEFIINLRNPFSFDHEVKDQIKFSKEKGNEINDDFIEKYSALLVLQSRYRQYESKLNELFDLEYESMFVLGKDNVITNYILFIKRCKEDILDSGQKIGYYNTMLADRKTTSQERLSFREKRRQHTEKVYNIGDDQISNDLNKYYNECDSFLKSHQSRFKIT